MDVRRCLRQIIWLGLAGMLVLCAKATEVEFPDPSLETAILEALGMERGPIDSQVLGQLTTLLAGSRGIADLTGLEACVSLEQLQLHLNQIVELQPLAGLHELKSLTLNGNGIDDITPLSTLYNLTSLSIHGNLIADAESIATLPLLESLSIGNQLRDIEPLAQLPLLSRLLVYVQPTTDLSPLLRMSRLELLLVNSGRTVADRIPFECSYLAQCARLTNLRLEGYDILSMADLIRFAPAISELALIYVGMDDLSLFPLLLSLTKLTLSGVIPGSEGAALSDLALSSAVSTLVLENNELEDISPLRQFPQLTNLSLARNQITNIEDLESLSNLIVLNLSFNPITDLSPLLSLTALKSLTLQAVPFDQTEGSHANRVIDELRDRGVNITY